MKKIINILIIAAIVVLAGIVVVVLFITGILGGGGKSEPAISEPPVESTSPKPSPSATPSTAPPPTATAPPSSESPSPEPVTPSIPGGGDEIRVSEYAEFEFKPDRSGVWVFFTSDTQSDPDITIYDEDGSYVAYDDDSAGGYDALIIVELEAGVTYLVETKTYGGSSDSPFTLTVKPAKVLDDEGDSVRVQGADGCVFTPKTSGLWEFSASDVAGDPYLILFDEYGWEIDGNISGSNLNDHFVSELSAGVTYFIWAKNYVDSPNSFTLTVSPVEDKSPQSAIGIIETYHMLEPFEGVEFTPDVDGIYIVYTSDNGDFDPMLAIYGPDFTRIAENDDGWGDYNAMLSMFFYAGNTYGLVVESYDDTYGTCALNVKGPGYITANEGFVDVINTSGFVFIPERSGTYEFRTSSPAYTDPYLEIYDSDINYVGGDDDGDGLDVWLIIDLVAGKEYHILVGFYNYDDSEIGFGECTLTLTGG